MATRTMALCGIDRKAEESVQALFQQAARQSGMPWEIVAESQADALLIDIDSMYGQMSWMKAQGGPRPVVALTSSSRASADYILPRDFDAAALAGILTMLAERVEGHADAPKAPEPAAPEPAKVAAAPTPAAPVESKPAPAPEPEPEPEAEPPAPPRAKRLVDFLLSGSIPGPVKLKQSDPALVIDDRNRVQVVLPREVRDRFLIVIDVSRDHLSLHEVRDRVTRGRSEDLADGHHAL